MKKIQLIICITVLFITVQCKKNVTTDSLDAYAFTDEDITADKIILNVLATVTGGSFSIHSGGLAGSVWLPNSIVKVNDRKFNATNCVEGVGCGFELPDFSSPNPDQDQYTFFQQAYQKPTVNFKLFDGLGKKIIEYTLHYTKPVNLIVENKNYSLTGDVGNKIIVKWNANPDNKLGVSLQLGLTAGTKNFVLPDNGEFDITDFCIQNGRDVIPVSVTRGVVMLEKGSDGLTYKLSNLAQGSEIIHIY